MMNYGERKSYNICSGSLGEGVAYPGSDDDLMSCFRFLRVVTSYREATQIGDFLMIPSENAPGYCLLLNLNLQNSADIIQIIEEIPFPSSSLWKQFFSDNGEGQYIHGPCHSGKIGSEEYDLANSISCCTWPDVANGWKFRDRLYNWPLREIVQDIIQNGCHVVPVGDPASPYSAHEWRISFSVAERMLMHSFNHIQFLVYNLLRLTLKRIIGKAFPEVLCSYFMKTTLFYTTENTPLQFWQGDNLEACFRTCLSVLYDYVDYRYCPNYFMPEYNMIKRKINHTNRLQMLDMIRNVHKIGIIGVIHLSGESICLSGSLSQRILEWKLDIDFMISDHLNKSLSEITNFFKVIPEENIGCCTFHLSRYWRLLEENFVSGYILNIFWNEGIFTYCLKMMDYLLTSPGMNKICYKLYKSLKSLLKIGLRGNVSTEKLTLATYMYMVGKTKSALLALRILRSECPPYVVHHPGHQHDGETYVYMMCGRGYNIDYKMRRAYSPSYRLKYVFLNAYPLSMKILIALQGAVILDPLTYAHFVESLCHVKNQNQRMLKNSIKCLVQQIEDAKEEMDIVTSKMCVGIIKYVQGDTLSACRWFGSAYISSDSMFSEFKETLSSSAFVYVALLINIYFNSGNSN